MRRVYVRWVDSCSLGGEWMNRGDIDSDEHQGECFCETLGWLVDENDHSYYVAGHLSPEQYGSVWQIPRVAVKELNYLEDEDGEAERGETEEATGERLRWAEPFVPGS